MASPNPVEILETRIALNGSAIGAALGVPAGGYVYDAGQPSAISIASNFRADGLFGFPTGADDQYVVLSTGDATKFNLAGYSHHGTDWTSKGPPGDDVSLFLDVPVPAGAKRMKIDFMLFTQEEPTSGGHVNQFEDFFKVVANGGNGDTTLVDYTVDTAPYATGVETGNFLHRTYLLTMNYQVPAGASSVGVFVSLGDHLDGTGDTAVIMDNLRFEQSANLVYLNFEGGTTNALGPGTTLTMPAFQPSDLGYPVGTDRDTVINEIVSEVTAKYSSFDVSFVTTKPVAGDYTTVMIGGNQNAPVAIGAGASPLQLRQYPAGTSFATFTALQAGSTLFGQALGGVDVGNKSVTDVTVVFPQSFASAYSTDDAATREDRMVVTISHELGHALGLRHIQSSDVNDPNIMKQRSPRSSTAGFEDLTRALATDELTFWTDKATQQNDAAYLRGILGSVNDSDVELGISPLAFSKYVTALFSAIFGGTLYNAYLGVIPGQPLDSDGDSDFGVPVMFSVGDLVGDQLLKIPVTSTTDKIVFWGQSTAAGPVDVFSGTPDANGELTFENSGIQLFDGTGHLNTTLPTAIGIPGSLAAGPALGMQASDFTVALLPFGTYQDADGDTYTIKLTGKTGIGGFVMNDPDGDGKGSIDRIMLQDTTIKDKLTITVKKPTKAQTMAGLNGLVNIGSIEGGTLAGIDAKSSNLVGPGIDFGNLLGALTVRDVLNGADIRIGGGESVKTKITAHDIADGTDIVSRSTITSLIAARIGNGSIDAPVLGTLTVKGDLKAGIAGDFGSDITLEHTSPFLTLAILKKSVFSAATISGTTHGVSIDVDGPMGAFKTGRFVDSILNIHSFNAAAPASLKSFTATGIKNVVAAAFDNSDIIANIIGSVTLASVDTDNGGSDFGITAHTSIASVTSKSLLPGATKFKYDKKNSAAQGVDDFVVQIA